MARSLSQTVARLNSTASDRAGHSTTIGLRPSDLSAVISLADDIRP